MTVTLSVSLPVPRAETTDGLEVVRRAAELGYDGCWASEVQGPDAFTQLGALAATTDLQLGVAVVPVQTRTAMVLGMSAITLAELTDGRFSLGLGSSSELIARQWAGQPFDAPYTHVRETLEAVQPLLRGDRASYGGRFVTVEGYRPHVSPKQPVPLYLAALGPRMLALAGELADGVCLNQLAPHHVMTMLDQVEKGAHEAGRTLEGDFGVMARIFCAVTDDLEATRKVVKRTFAPYVATSVYNAFYERLGYEAEAAAVAAAAAEGDRDGMTTAMSDRLVDELFVLGDAAAVTEKVKDYVAAGVTVPVISSILPGPEAALTTLRAIAERW